MKAWLFDLDGVLTNPEAKKANSKIIKKIASFLDRGDLIGFNTGRSLKFVVKDVLKPLKSEIHDQDLLKKIFSVGEKGGDWALYKDGQLKIKTDKTLSPPKELEEKIRNIIKEKYSATTFFDSSKKAMISAEIIKGADLSAFHKDQQEFDKEFQQILEEMNLNHLILEPNIIATDIQDSRMGKDLGVQRFLDMIKDLHEPDEFETFGDSPGDLEMYRYLIRNGHKAKFIYVGKKDIEDGENIIKTQSKYDLGTLEYLQNI